MIHVNKFAKQPGKDKAIENNNLFGTKETIMKLEKKLQGIVDFTHMQLHCIYSMFDKFLACLSAPQMCTTKQEI